MSDKPKVLYVCTASHTKRVFRPGKYEEMLELFDVTENNGDTNWTSEEVAERAVGMNAIITGWGAPPMIPAVFEAAPELKIIAHTAGSVHRLVPNDLVRDYVLPRGITVFSGNKAIGRNVAEAAIGMLLMTMRHWVPFNNYYHRTGHWQDPHFAYNGQFLQGSTVGLVAASAVGREVIRLLEPWDITILVYDPYLSDEGAAELGVEKVELNELFRRSDHVSIHAPVNDETRGMIGAEQLALLRDGATLVTTVPGGIMDDEALAAEARTRRINMCLDCTTPEPPTSNHWIRGLDNVITTPHCSGAGFYGYFEIGDTGVQALVDCFAGRPVEGAVPMDRYNTVA